MVVSVLQILPDVNQESFERCSRPTKDIGEEHQADTLETRFDVV